MPHLTFAAQDLSDEAYDEAVHTGNQHPLVGQGLMKMTRLGSLAFLAAETDNLHGVQAITDFVKNRLPGFILQNTQSEERLHKAA